MNDKKEVGPRFYEKMSKLLTDLREAQRRGALAYEAFLKKMEELAVKGAAGDTSEGETPVAMKKSPFAVAVFNNLASLPVESLSARRLGRKSRAGLENHGSHGQKGTGQMARDANAGKHYSGRALSAPERG